MKKITILTLALASLISLKAAAEVQFLPEATENAYTKSSASSFSDSQRCTNGGYKYTSCEGALVDECPYQSGYYRICCPAGYTYRRSECLGNASADSCHGFYKCEETPASRCLAEGYRPLPVPTEGITYTRPCNGQSYDHCPYDTGYFKCRTSSGGGLVVGPALPITLP